MRKQKIKTIFMHIAVIMVIVSVCLGGIYVFYGQQIQALLDTVHLEIDEDGFEIVIEPYSEVLQSTVLSATEEDVLLEEDTDEDETLALPSSWLLDDFKWLSQYPELPQGCEVVSLCSVLQYDGFHIDKVQFAREYLPTSALDAEEQNPEEYYIGDPEGLGWYCFEAPIIACANAFLEDENSDLQAMSITGASKTEIQSYIAQDIPVIVWVTIDYEDLRYYDYEIWQLDGEMYAPLYNLHAIVIIGYDNDRNEFHVSDPMVARLAIAADDLMASFEAMGSRAVVII